VYELWSTSYDEFPVFADKQHQEDIMVKTMLAWRENSQPKDSQPKKQSLKKNCEIDVLQRRVEDGADSIQLIRPDIEMIPDHPCLLSSSNLMVIEFLSFLKVPRYPAGNLWLLCEVCDVCEQV
jgi:hypothetical protein